MKAAEKLAKALKMNKGRCKEMNKKYWTGGNRQLDLPWQKIASELGFGKELRGEGGCFEIWTHVDGSKLTVDHRGISGNCAMWIFGELVE